MWLFLSYLISNTDIAWPCGKITPTGLIDEHECVDLGLSVKWATMNVGATSQEDYGDYFAWGETSSKNSYDWENLKYCKGGFSKYVTDRKYGTVDNKTCLELIDDAARANWGGNWRMPTETEFKELKDKCTWRWVIRNGVKGYKVTSKSNGRSIFLPAAGFRSASSLYGDSDDGYYYSSTLHTDLGDGAYELFFNSRSVDCDYGCRQPGRSVRPVYP